MDDVDPLDIEPDVEPFAVDPGEFVSVPCPMVPLDAVMPELPDDVVDVLFRVSPP